MKFARWSKLEVYSFLFSMPPIIVMMHLIMYKGRVWNEPRIWWISAPLIFIIGIISMHFHVQYGAVAETKFPSLRQSRQRITLKALVLLFVMTPSLLLIFLLYDYFHIVGYHLRTEHLWQGMLVGLSINLVFETLYELDYIFHKFRESTAEKETMQQLSVHEEFDSLKSQVNPHFLFNCFNTLSSLISVDKVRAGIFLDELSKVYRYLLKNNKATVSTLDNELKFIQSYFRLLQTRHGEAVQLNLKIDKQYLSYLIPSLTLQLLIENAVKHNSLSKNYPLVIDIFTATGNKLVVNNNLQRRAVKAPGTGIGLQNIQLKYQLLKQEGFQIMEGGKNFTVVLPLIWKSQQFSGKDDDPHNEIANGYGRDRQTG